ncbi:MAG: nucleotidyltransferase domain-containing protein [Deltaproteobacteria bacterium]|nr:nucleotidyltransferase domain-containing protein [Deltaproteobacteria bacterium]
MPDKNIETAKKIITEEVEHAGYKVDRIILFGSRARGDYEKGSDYDFLIVLKQNISHNDESALLLKIRRQMAKLKIDNDTLISSSDRLQEDNNVGNITYYALKHGVSV